MGRVRIMQDFVAHTPWQRLGHQLKLGLRSRAEADWLPHDDLFGNASLRARQIALKASLSAERHGDIFAALPGSAEAGAETYSMVREHLARYHAATAPAIPAQPDPHLHPLDAATRAIPEDLLLLEPRTTTPEAPPGENPEPQTLWHLCAGALAFPAHWVLAEKMGLPLAAIHEPVPHYGERLERPMDRFFNAMQIGPISARMNWSLQAGETYYAPHREDRTPLRASDVETRLFLRIENQTLRKLPQTGAILFTIRTHMVPFGYWRTNPGAVGELIDMFAEMSADSYAYKCIHLYEDALRDWHTALLAA